MESEVSQLENLRLASDDFYDKFNKTLDEMLWGIYMKSYQDDTLRKSIKKGI